MSCSKRDEDSNLMSCENLKEVILNICEGYSQIKENILNEDIVEWLGDINKGVKIFNIFRSKYSIYKFDRFLKGFNYNNCNDNDVSRLIEYLKSDEKVEFVASTFDKILSSNSKKSCYIMGMLFSEIVEKNKSENITKSDLMIINALSLMNDCDIESFVYLYSSIEESNKEYIITDEMKIDYKNKYNISDLDLKLSLNTMQNASLVEKGSNYNEQNELLTFDELKFTKLSEKLYKCASCINMTT